MVAQRSVNISIMAPNLVAETQRGILSVSSEILVSVNNWVLYLGGLSILDPVL